MNRKLCVHAHSLLTSYKEKIGREPERGGFTWGLLLTLALVHQYLQIFLFIVLLSFLLAFMALFT